MFTEYRLMYRFVSIEWTNKKDILETNIGLLGVMTFCSFFVGLVTHFHLKTIYLLNLSTIIHAVFFFTIF